MKSQLIAIVAAVLVVGCVMFSFIKNIFKKTLHKACVKGDIEAVKQFLGDGVDVNAKDEDGWTPLHGAAWWGHTETAKFLIGSGADVHAQGAAGNTPLHEAARSGRKEIAELLIDKGAEVNAKDSRRWTPLHEAADWRHEEIVELLIAEGADVNAENVDGYTPLGHAERHPEIADLLRKHGGKTGEELAKPEPPTAKVPDISIFNAAEAGNIEAVKQHLAAGTDVNARGEDSWTPLHSAAQGERKEVAEVVELLIAEGADVNAKTTWGGTPLHRAAIYGYKEIAEVLIAAGADVNAKYDDGNAKWETPLDLAIEENKKEIADLLRKHGGKTGEELK